MRKTIIGSSVMLLLLGCGGQEPQQAKGPDAKSMAAFAGKANVPPQVQAEAESVARRFLIAMFENDADGVKQTILPCPRQAALWEGKPLKPAQRELVRKQVAGMTAREANAGEALRFPDGRTAIAAPPLLGEGRTVLVLENAQTSLVFVLAQLDGHWRVDAGSFIAACEAAKAARERNRKPSYEAPRSGLAKTDVLANRRGKPH